MIRRLWIVIVISLALLLGAGTVMAPRAGGPALAGHTSGSVG